MPTDLVVNFDEDADKRKLWGVLRTLKGRHRVEVARYRPRRSDQQNKWYWGVIMPMAAHALTESQGETFDPETAHQFFKALFLSRPVVDRRSGELLTNIVGSSAVLDTARYTEYVEQVRQWMAEYLGVVVPDPEAFGAAYGSEKRKHAAAAAGE